jgi:sirohydrochlorin cobaltochelatase
MTTTQQRAIVLFAHGSRDPQWHRPIEAVARTLTLAQPDVPVRCAYLELSTPDLATACRELIEAGSGLISVVPLFLGVGRHAREDLPLLVEQLRAEHPAVAFALKTAVGEDPRLIALLADIASE